MLVQIFNRVFQRNNMTFPVLVDFINMKSEDTIQELVAVLKAEIKKDPVSCSFIDVTKLGIFELTRKKTYKSLKELIN